MKKLITFLMLLSVFGIGNVWADEANFNLLGNNAATTVNGITISGGNTSNSGYNTSSGNIPITVSTESGTITAITLTFENGTNADRYGGTVTVNTGTYTREENSAIGYWTGSASSVTFTPTKKFRITAMSVTFTPASPTEYDYVINIADLRFEHLTYNPGRTGIYGFDITSSGWQSQTTGDEYSLLLSSGALATNSFTVAVNSANSSAKITQMVIVGDEGTFANVSAIRSTNTYETTSKDQIIWQNSTGASSATIEFTSSDRPKITTIYVKTDAKMTYSKQDVILTFSPASGTANVNVTDYQIDGRLKMGDQYFRADSYTVSNADGSNATYNQFHLSTGKVGVNTGANTGTATITATFDGTNNPFYNTATSGIYTLTVEDASLQAKTITVNDMRISKTANSNGLNASRGLDRILGGFEFAFTGGDNAKYNNTDYILLRNDGGQVVITPQNSGSGTILIKRVDINTYSGYDGTIKVNGGSNININNVNSYSFTGLDQGTFTLTSVSGNVRITGFTIYYSVPEDATLNDTNVKPVITFSKSSDSNVDITNYTSPTITTTPANFDIDIASDNISVATVKNNNWTDASLVSLEGSTGNATITASASPSTYFDAADDANYTVNVTSTPTSKMWDFTTLDVTNTINTTEWEKSGDYYQNKFTAAQNDTYSTENTVSQIYGLQFSRNNSGGLKAEQIRLFGSYMTFTNSAMLINVPVIAGQSVTVTFDGGNGDTEAGFKISNATVEGDASATKILSDATQSSVTLIATSDGYVTLETTKSKVKLYSIQVKSETRGTLDLRDSGSNNYERNVGTDPSSSSSDNHFNHRVTFTPSDGAANPVTYADDASGENIHFHITSSNPSVLDANHAYIAESSFGNSSSFYFNNIIPLSAGTATLTITFDGNNGYKANSYTSAPYTIYGPTSSYTVAAENQEIQQGQFSNITPKITDENGNLLGIRLMEGSTDRYTTYVLGEDEDEPDYSEYFTFSYSAAESGTGSNWEKITVDANGKITTEDENEVAAAVGATRKITVTATPKEAYASAFASTTGVTTELTVTIIEKTANIQVDFFWDADCTTPITLATSTVSGTDNTYADKVNVFNSGIFNNGFPNGRVIYAKPKNEGDAIWFSYAQNGDAAVIPANPSVDKKKRIFQYRRGIPIYIDDDLASGNTDYVNVNIVATTYDANTKKYNLRGTVARLKFPKIITHARPAQPTYDPVSPDANAAENKDGRKIMNTSENVVAYGKDASKDNPRGAETLVYGKFSTGTVYTTEMLINENAVQQGIGSVPVVSTEVAKRRFTSVQIEHYTSTTEGNVDYNGADYISEQTYTEYWYLYDTDLRLYTNAERTTALTSYSTVLNTASPAPYYKVTWYNKRNYDDPKNYNLGVTQEVDDYAGKITYAITGTNGTITNESASVDANGRVTVTSGEGWVKVTATYNGGEQHGGKSGEPQYTSTTDESTADYYVYVYDAEKKVPTITPPTRNFTGTLTYRIQAPNDWPVRYTSGIGSANDPTATSGNELAAGAYIDITIGDGMTVDQRLIVKAIAYKTENNNTISSAVVSEAYTKKDALPAPTFDPSGVAEPYKYNTNELTVQIACAYPSAVIYYTTDGKEPVIGASNTYKYSGLSKVVISGNVTITAVAYDPVQQIYSPIVPSRYVYSSVMNKPYFQISDDGGSTWYGYNTEDASSWVPNGKAWYNGQTKEITPSTQIRIVDPNPVTGTIYYTVNGIDPADDATTMIYSEGYPFTVGKTTTGKAITILEDAQSPVSTAIFNINTDTYGNVWEAVGETTTEPSGKKRGIYKDDGFVISQTKTLYNEGNTDSNNSMSKVNVNSISSEKGGTASKMYAQQYITATLGGYDLGGDELGGWEKFDLADAAVGSPIDAVGSYSLKTQDNAKDEKTKNYNHVYSYKTTPDKTGNEAIAATTHEKTFKVPANGTFVRFEPERDGDLTIWVLQQGALLYEDDTYFIDNVLRLRPVYLVDEQGQSQKVKVVNNVPQMWSSARLSENWTKIQATAASNGWKDSKWIGPGNDDYNTTDAAYVQYVRVSDGALYNTVTEDNDHFIVEKLSAIPSGADKTKYYKKLVNKGPNKTETAAIYNMYKADLDKNYVSVGDPIKPFAIHTGTTISLNDNRIKDDSDDGTGYVLASGGYAKYTFELKAGKTYFFFAQGSKIGIRGFQFVAKAVDDSKTLTMTENNGENGNATAISAVVNKGTVKTTGFDRTFTANTWTTLVLPFSVSATALEKAFGAGTDVMHFDRVEGNKLYYYGHYHRMIVAGTPVFIKPTKAGSLNDLYVQVENETPEIMSSGDYSFQGYYDYGQHLNQYDYYLSKAGNFCHWTNAGTNLKSTRAVIHNGLGESGAKLELFMGSIDDEDSNLTGIEAVYDNVTGETIIVKNATVYNISGQVVRRNSNSLQGLPKGVYIVNGKKYVVE